MIAGFYEPDDGEILLNDKNIERVPPYNRNTAMVFQEYALFPHMNVFENVSYGLRVKHKPAEEIKKRVAEALSLMQLSGMENASRTRCPADSSSVSLSPERSS